MQTETVAVGINVTSYVIYCCAPPLKKILLANFLTKLFQKKGGVLGEQCNCNTTLSQNTVLGSMPPSNSVSTAKRKWYGRYLVRIGMP